MSQRWVCCFTCLRDNSRKNNMNDVEFSEAIRLLSQPLRCEDIEFWRSEKQQPDTWSCSGGLLKVDGVSAAMLVELIYRRSQKTGIVLYKFSVFLQHAWGLERVYQLEVRQAKRPLKDVHSRPHEHFGDQRTLGEPSWSTWTFHDTLRHFEQRTGIEFDPLVQEPDHFELKGCTP